MALPASLGSPLQASTSGRKPQIPSKCLLPRGAVPLARRALIPVCAVDEQHGESLAAPTLQPSRRDALALMLAAGLTLPAAPSQAIQGLTAGRIPGLGKQADDAGFFTYTRPEGKSGGHGVGWSEIPQYTFKVPGGWDETPVSIADLGGTEIDLRYTSREQGELAVVVAPVLRFMDVGYNAQITLKDIGPPDRVIAGFAPELFGKPLDDDGDVLQTLVETDSKGQLYYFWELKPHNLVAATAVRNRVFILTLTSSTRQWKKFSDQLRTIQKSFRVPGSA